MSYAYNRTVTIDHTKVPNTDQSNFPVCFSGTYSWLATVANGGHVTNSSGYDIVFTSDAAGLTVLDFEIELYTASNGQVVFWIRVPTVSHTSDTVFYIFYNNPSITTSQENAHGVWDSNYIGVWHGHVTGSGTYTSANSTAASHNGTYVGANNPTDASGKIDGCMDVGNGGGAPFSLDTFTDLFDGSNQIWTIEGWYANNQETTFTRSVCIGSVSGASNVVRVNVGNDGGGNNAIRLVYETGTWYSGNAYAVNSYSNTIAHGVFYHIVMVLDLNAQTGAIYYNGAANSGTFTKSGTIGNTLNSLGSALRFGDFPPSSAGFGGLLDEIRFSKSARSVDWAKSSYNNQNRPSTFYALGSENAFDPSTVPWQIFPYGI